MPDETSAAITSATTTGVKTYQVDGERAEKYGLKELIEADRYAQNRSKSQTCGVFSMFQGMIGKIRPTNQ